MTTLPRTAAAGGSLRARIRDAAVNVLAAAIAVAGLASLLPAVLTPVPVAALLPEPPPVVARTPVAPSGSPAA